ncbi:MAG: glycerol-3-phosphate dehydrogenase/oxidase [Chitinophagales bacterium]|nr:glycerol-3-phosphate dehydrogenase/oxidase [Chitinophagales bacterium]
MNSFSNKFRSKNLGKISSVIFDVIVIGGGITGAGIAHDASSRGLKVALIEKNDFASGTSSKSTKLIHGGLRYLQNFQFNQVRITARERKILHRNIPHLVKPQDIVIPVYRHNNLSMLKLSVGLSFYEFLGSVSKGDRHRKLNRDELISLIPNINTSGLIGGFIYKEYKTNDSRLVIETLKEAYRSSAQIFNYLECTEIKKDEDQYQLTCVDRLNHQNYIFAAKVVVNAGGPWVDDVRSIEEKDSKSKLILSKGVHVVFKKADFPLDTAVYFEHTDSRLIFCVPTSSHVYVGTTDTFYSGSKEEVKTSKDDIDYLINAVNNSFLNSDLKVSHVRSFWAGLRPLIKKDGKSPGELSRKDEIYISNKGMITIAGGKLTGFRKMAENVVDLIFKKHFKTRVFVKSKTEDLTYFSSGYGKSTLSQIIQNQKEISDSVLIDLFEKYGNNILEVLEIYKKGHSIIDSEIIYTIQNEMMALPSDFLMRRTQNLYYPEVANGLLWNKCSELLEKEGVHFSEASKQDLKQVNRYLDFPNNIRKSNSD